MFKKKNIILFFLCLLLLIFVYSIRIIASPISIDTEVFINDSSSMIASWDSIGRYSLDLYKLFFNNFSLNLKVTNIISFIIIGISIAIFSYYILKKINKLNILNFTIFFFLIMTSSILTEEYVFTMQILEISISYLFLAISFILIDKIIYEKKYLFLLIIVPLLALVFGTYQAFVMLYITLCNILFICNYDSKIGLKGNLFLIVQFILILIVSYILNTFFSNIILSIKDVSKTSYLTDQINWLLSVKTGMKSLLVTMFNCIFGKGLVYNCSDFLIILFLMKYLFVNNKKDLLLNLSLMFLIITPFLLSLAFGNFTTSRAQLSLMFVISFLSIYLYDNRWVKIGCFIFIFLQLITTGLLFYNDNIRYNNDKEIANEVITYFNETKCNKIVFVGNTSYKILSGETLGISFYNWGYETDNLSNYRVYGFFKDIGYNYDYPSIEDIKKYKDIIYYDKYTIDNNVLVVNVSLFNN